MNEMPKTFVNLQPETGWDVNSGKTVLVFDVALVVVVACAVVDVVLVDAVFEDAVAVGAVEVDAVLVNAAVSLSEDVLLSPHSHPHPP